MGVSCCESTETIIKTEFIDRNHPGTKIMTLDTDIPFDKNSPYRESNVAPFELFLNALAEISSPSPTVNKIYQKLGPFPYQLPKEDGARRIFAYQPGQNGDIYAGFLYFVSLLNFTEKECRNIIKRWIGIANLSRWVTL